MKRKPGTQFWILLGAVNLLTLIYPIILLHRAKSVEEDFFANLILLAFLLLLAVVNLVSILDANRGDTGTDKR